MGTKFTDGLLAGVTAAVIWISICLMTDVERKTIGGWALIFLVIGLVGTIVISTVVERSRSDSQSGR